MPSLSLNCYPPYGKQQEILDHIFQPDPGQVRQVDLCCGRAYGKTFFLIALVCRALSVDGNQCGLFLEPDWAKINSVFWATWYELVPPELFKVNKGEQKITWINGSVLYYGPRNISGAIEAMRSKYRGLNLTFVVSDEEAMGCDAQMYTNTLAAIRKPSPIRFYFTASTPMVGEYRRLVTSENHVLYQGSSADNPYLPDGFVEQLRSNMSRDQARREIDGEFISLEGRIWKTSDLTKSWPAGTIDDEHPRFDRNKPWWLLCDLGSSTGAYVVVQQRRATYRGHELFPGHVWVAVADLCPINDASASRAFSILKQAYGTPVGVTAGADVNTKSSTDGTTVSYFAQQIWGNIPIYPCNESIYAKQVQMDVFNDLLERGDGTRRFTVARDFHSFEEDSKRGVREMLEEDEWPDETKRRMSDFLPKGRENRVQHTRDAILMGFSQLAPPRWQYKPNPPK
jgi:hypothetical protein